MNAGPRVSVGLPVYNGERYLPTALESLLLQSYGDFELLIADNGSTDGTEAIVRSYAARDARIHYIRHPRNLGAIANFDFVRFHTNGEYFRWAAADDVSAPKFLERCVEVLDRREDVVLAYPETDFIDRQGSITLEFEDSLRADGATPSARFQQLFFTLGRCNAVFGLIRRSAMARVGPLGHFLGSDSVFLAALSLCGSFWRIPERLLQRRFHDQTMTSMAPPARVTSLDPTGSTPGVLLGWQHYWEHWKVVASASIALREKVRLTAFLGRMAIADRDRLFRDATTGYVPVDAGARRT